MQKIPLEVFEGFPYLEDRGSKKIVRLADPTLLPPSNHDGLWILFLDEFNKADSDKMAAVMNLVLTGEIGGAADYNEKTGKSEKYRLPKKTVIIGAGNFREQENNENLNFVNQMDIATSERFHRAVFLDYNASSWIENFALKEYSFKYGNNNYTISTRIMPILLFYINQKKIEEGESAPFTIPIEMKPDEGGSERTTSPRAWTLVSDNMLLDALSIFEKLEDKSELEIKAGAKERSFDVFIQQPKLQVELISKQVFEFGLNGERIVNDIISRYVFFSKNQILPDEIIFSYKTVREKIISLKKDNQDILLLYLLIDTANFIAEAEVMKDIKTVSIYISTFLEDTKMPAEDITAFIYILTNSNNTVSEKVHKMLLSVSERYRNAYGDFYYTARAEIKNGKT